MQNPKESDLRALAPAHIRRYAEQLHGALQGNPNLRASENAFYLECWLGMLKKGFKWDALSDDERIEATEAFEDALQDRKA